MRSGGAFSWVRRIDGWALFAFACGVNVFFGYGQQRLLGLAMAGAGAVVVLTHPRRTARMAFPVPPELWVYTVWVVWAATTGYFVSQNSFTYWGALKVVIQVLAMVWIVYLILRTMERVDVVFLALVAGGLLQIGMVATGQSVGGEAPLADATVRLAGTMRNPNGLGFLMVWSVLCAFFFWEGGRRPVKIFRLLILALVPVAGFVVLASGSRKSAIAFALLLYAWVVFARGAVRSPGGVVASMGVALLVLVASATWLPDLVADTAVGRRFDQFMERGGGELGDAVAANPRSSMYIEGLKVFLSYPLFGVGLNNFGAHFYMGSYSHSDLIEPLATTGLPGFLLYQSFYVLLVLRARRLLKVLADQELRYRLKMILLGVMSILVIGLGAPHYTTSPVFLLLTAFSVFTFQLERQVLAQRAVTRVASSASERLPLVGARAPRVSRRRMGMPSPGAPSVAGAGVRLGRPTAGSSTVEVP